MSVLKNETHKCINGDTINVVEGEGAVWFLAADVLKATRSQYYSLEHTCVIGREVRRLLTDKGTALYVSLEGLLTLVPHEQWYYKARTLIVELILKYGPQKCPQVGARA
jgi:hypothetical protein